MKKQFITTQLKELIKKGAKIEVYDNNYNTTSLFEMAKEAKKSGSQLLIHIRNSEYDDLCKILNEGGKAVTFIFD
ncbi:hypothetical protein ES708_14363 [subsurface metagenome]